MRSPVSTLLLAGVLALSAAFPVAANAFDLDGYLEHLAAIRDLDGETLIDAHRPYGPYRFEMDAPLPDADYLDEVAAHYELTGGERDLLARHGFMVSERLEYASFGRAFLDVWKADLPVFVSSDAILHALHRSYVDVLATTETKYLAPTLAAGLAGMHEGWAAMASDYAGVDGLSLSLNDVDLHLTVARSLLAGYQLPSESGNDSEVRVLLDLVAAEQMVPYPLFNQSPRYVDFSQFTPRGHYTRTETLKRYFKAMMWLGRTELRLTEPPGEPATPDVTREIVDAFLLRELADRTGARAQVEDMDTVLRALAGDSDNITFDGLDRLAEAVGLHSAAELLEPGTMGRFRAELAAGDYAPQAINSQILLFDPFHPEDLDPPFAFLLLGQRFVVDSYIFAQVVFDRIDHEGSKPFRELPTPLDALYCLGNDDALPLLDAELAAWHYAPNLSALRYLVDGYEDPFWEQSLYNTWLGAIRSLALSGRDHRVPDFMTTGAWQQEKMNSQLASWAELRHDNLLYAKQSYSGGVACSYPATYVEPIPQLYDALGGFARRAAIAFGPVSDDGSYNDVGAFFGRMAGIMDTLEAVADKELSGTAFTPEEERFLASVLFERNGGCTMVDDGWYRDLFFGWGQSKTTPEDLVVADVHTAPTDASGAFVGHVLHVGTGYPDMGVFLAAPPGGALTAFAGPVASYHEYVTSGFERLTDEEWADMFETGPPVRPDWTYVYLADADGAVREGGRLLVTEADSTWSPGPAAPPAILLAPNSPNPFADETLIGFRIEGSGAQPVSLAVYDVRGRRVAQLLDDVLGPNTYQVRWRGTDARGVPVAAGIYYALLRVGDRAATRKITKIR